MILRKRFKFIMGLLVVFLCSLLVLHPAQSASPDPAAQRPGIDMVIVLDRSGSMKNTDPQGLSTPAACFLVEQLALGGEGNRAAVVPFGNRASVLGQEKPTPATALTSNLPGLSEWLQASSQNTFTGFRESSQADTVKFHHLLRDQMQERGNTELGLALDLAAEILQPGGHERQKMIVLISDGVPEPNLVDPKRAEELAGAIGNAAVAASRQRGAASPDLINKFGRHILDNTVSSLADRGISVFPIAFQREGEESQFLINYLESIKEMTTGNREIRKATPSTLVEQMMDFIPTGEEYLQFLTMKGNARLVQGGSNETVKEYEFDLPDITRQARIVLPFPNARSAQSVRVELSHNGKPVADSAGNMPADIIHSGPHRRDGALAYHSFRFMRPETSTGHWKIRLSDASRGEAEHLPDTDLLVDIRTETELVLTTETPSGQLRAGEPATLRFKLLGKRGGAEYPLPITRLDAFLNGRNPEAIRSISDRFRDVGQDGPMAVANLAEGFSAPGEYLVHGNVYFNTDPPTRELKVHVARNITIEPGTPVEAWLNKRNVAATGPDPNLRCDLPPLGDSFSLSYDDLEVNTNSYIPAAGVLITADPFIHKETGKALDRKWVKLTPASLRGLKVGTPLPVTVEVNLPDQIPADVPDGLYECTLRLRQGTRTLASATLALTIAIPRFVAKGEEVNAPYLGPDQEQPLTVEHIIRYPGNRGHEATALLRSTSLPGIDAQIYLDMAEGADATSGERTKNLVYTPVAEAFAIPGKNSGRPGEVSLNTELTDPSLDGRDFENTLTIMAPPHRSRSIRVLRHVRIIPPWWPRLTGALVLLAAAFLAWVSYRIWRERRLFIGYSDTSILDPTELRYRGDQLGTFNYDRDRQTLTFSPGPDASASFESNSRPQAGQVSIGPGWSPGLYDQLYLTHNRTGSRFALQILQVPDARRGEHGYGFEVVESRLGRGGQRHLFLALALILVAAGVFLCVQPYALLPWLGI